MQFKKHQIIRARLNNNKIPKLLLRLCMAYIKYE